MAARDELIARLLESDVSATQIGRALGGMSRQAIYNAEIRYRANRNRTQ